MSKKKKEPEIVPDERQLRLLRKHAQGLKSEDDFNKRFSHVKNPQTLALYRKWIQSFVKF